MRKLLTRTVTQPGTRAMVVAVLLTLPGCGQGAEAPGSTALPGTTATAATPVTIGYSRLRISLPVFVAKERRIFAKHGIDATLMMYDTAQPLMQALVEGRIHVAGYTALPITFNGMLRSGKPLYFLTAMVEDRDHRISYLLRAKTAPGAKPIINSIADLRGRKIGILPTIAYKGWLEAILKANGVAPEEVVIQLIEPLLQPQALATGGVDALFTNDPAATAAIIGAGAELITDTVEVPAVLGEPLLFGSFNVSREWGDAHPVELAGLTAALDEAVAFVNAHPAEAKEMMRPYLPTPFRPHIGHYPDALYLSSNLTSPAAFEGIARRYLELGLLPGPVPLSGLVLRRADLTAP